MRKASAAAGLPASVAPAASPPAPISNSRLVRRSASPARPRTSSTGTPERSAFSCAANRRRARTIPGDRAARARRAPAPRHGGRLAPARASYGMPRPDCSHPAGLVDRHVLSSERPQRHRDQLEVRQAERNPDDRDALCDARDQVSERELPPEQHHPDDVADERPRPRRVSFFTSVRPNGHRQNLAIRSAAKPNGIVMIRMKATSAARV